jgi:hypothetical protein
MPRTYAPPSAAAAILSRVIQPEESDLTPAAAKAFLRFTFSERDRERMHELAARNQDGLLTGAEQQELENYLQVGLMVDLLQAKARLSLSRAASRRAAHG